MKSILFLLVIIGLILLYSHAQETDESELAVNEEEIQIDESVAEMAAELGLDDEKEKEFQEIMSKLKAAGFGNTQVFRGGKGGGAMSQDEIIKQLGGDPRNKMNLDENDENVERLSKRESRKARKEEKKSKRESKKETKKSKREEKKADKKQRRSSRKHEL